MAILAWLLALALAVGAFLAFGGTLTSAVTIPGTPTAQVTDRLKEEFPDAARGTGQVLFVTEDGAPFTQEQKDGVAAALGQVAAGARGGRPRPLRGGRPAGGRGA